jgi:hypothetical protein
MVSPGGPPVSNPITGAWRNSFADKGQKGRDLQKFDRVEELVCDWGNILYRIRGIPTHSLTPTTRSSAAL